MTKKVGSGPVIIAPRLTIMQRPGSYPAGMNKSANQFAVAAGDPLTADAAAECCARVDQLLMR